MDENGNYKKDAKGNFIPAKLTPGDIYQKAQRHTSKRTAEWYNNAWLTTPERRSTWRDMRMFSGEDLQIKIDTASFEADSEKVSKWMDKLTKQYEEFRTIADKTGDEGLASRLVFGEDGVTQAKEYYDVISKLSGLMRSLGVARSIPSLMDMSDAELEEKYTGKVYEPMLNLIKRAREINQERIKDENDTLAEILAKNQSFADKMAAIYAKEQKQLRVIREDSMKEHPTLTNEQSNRAIDTIQKNAAKERGGLIFDEFTNSEYYKQMFDNLDVYSTKALENLQLHLKEVKAQAGELKPEDMKAYIDAVNKLQDILGSRRPFKGMSNALNAYYDYKGTPEGDRKGGNVFSTSIEMMRAYRDLQKEIDSLTEQQSAALDKKVAIQSALNNAVEREQTAQQKLDNAYERAAEKQGITKQKDGTYADSKGNTVAASTGQLQGVLVTAVDPGIENAKKGLAACRSEVIGWTAELGKADGEIAVINGKLQGATSAQKMMGESARKVFSEIGNYANMAGEGFSSIMGIFGQEDSSFATIGSAAISGVGDIATGFATGGPIGGAIGGLKAIGGLVKGIAQAHDNKLNKAIEESQKRVTQLKNDYTAMQKVIERQLGGQTAAQSENMLNNLKKQRSELQGQMRDEEAKKKTDDAKVQDYKNQIAEMDDQIKYFSADLAKSLYDIDVKSWASELGDALFEAWQKGENGADAFKKKANDILASLTKNVMNKMIMEKALQPVYDYLFGDNGVFNDNALSDDDLIGLSGKLHDAEGITEQIYGWLDKINEGYKQNGMDVKNGTSDSSTSLTAGIKNITEETADLLAAYLNAIRADVSVMRSIQTSYMEKVSALVDIYAKVDLIKMNQSILLQENYLQQIAENSRQLLTLTESINASNQNMSDLFDRVSNGTKSLTVKVK